MQTNKIRNILSSQSATSENQPNQFGTFAGVFTPTVLTILGVIMYLRLGQVVGNNGLLGAILVILLAHVITVSTGLSVSSVATNTRVGAGGAFAIIAQSLGLEVGGSVGIPLYLAQTISVVMYVFGFSEVWLRIFPTHPAWLITILTFLIVFAIAYVSAHFASRIQFLILAIVGFSLFSIFMGAFPIAGQSGFTHTLVLWGAYPLWSFWESFAIFFPAVTGIMVGISLSGDLRNPRQSIPVGTMSAIGVTLVIYLVLTYWLARVATPEELLGNTTIMVDKAIFGWTVLAGMLGATFSSALGSLVAAPRVQQALADHSILPYSQFFAQDSGQVEPRRALLVTGGLSFAVLLVAIPLGGLNAIAPIITIFFLITYGMLNVVVAVEQKLATISFRPTFHVPIVIPIIGVISCLFVTLLVSPVAGALATLLVLFLYVFLMRRNLNDLDTDVRSGLFLQIARWAATQAGHLPRAEERTWSPTLLAPVREDEAILLLGSYRFLWGITFPQGSVHILGIFAEQPPRSNDELTDLVHSFEGDGVHANLTVLEDADFVNGVRVATQVLQRTFYRPNILFFHLRPSSDLVSLQTLVDKTAAYRMGVVLLASHPHLDMGREQIIHVWVSSQAPDWQLELKKSNIDLAILLAYQLMRNWHGRLNLCMAVANEEEKEQAHQFLVQLIELTRLPAARTEIVVVEAPFLQAVKSVSRPDLSFFGLPKPARLSFCQEIVSLVDGSCVFVRDSGYESALA